MHHFISINCENKFGRAFDGIPSSIVMEKSDRPALNNYEFLRIGDALY
jgi:hypothetical protein